MTGGSFDRLASLWFVASCVVLQPGNNACTIMCASPAPPPMSSALGFRVTLNVTLHYIYGNPNS